jgi:hypothetical protein
MIAGTAVVVMSLLAIGYARDISILLGIEAALPPDGMQTIPVITASIYSFKSYIGVDADDIDGDCGILRAGLWH